MYSPLYLLPNAMSEERETLVRRWHEGENEEQLLHIIKKIEAGAGEDFLQ